MITIIKNGKFRNLFVYRQQYGWELRERNAFATPHSGLLRNEYQSKIF